jgi:two-component system CheB/CheR fusion protein
MRWIGGFAGWHPRHTLCYRDITEDGTMRILVVDDTRDQADSLGMLLGFWGHERLTAYDGLSGLEAARAHRPHCMIIDINMPLMNGYALAEAIRRDDDLRHAKLIALTASTHEEAPRRAQEAGFDCHLTKPADLVELRALLAAFEMARPSEGPASPNQLVLP